MAITWKPLLILPGRQLAAELNPLLAQAMPGSVPMVENQYPFRDDLNAWLGQRPNIVFLDVSEDRDRAVEVISLLQMAAPTLPIVALLRDNDPDYILRCLRQGATEFLMSPITGEQVQVALGRLGKKVSDLPANVDSKVICVMPAKGACGATTVVSTMAYYWKKQSNKRFLLADLDPLSGTLSFLLKLKAQYSFLDVISRAEALDADLWRGMVVNKSGVDVLLSPEETVAGLDQLRDPSHILEYTRSAYDYVFLDAGRVYGEWNLGLARQCDELLLVTTNELPALQAAQRALQYLERHRVSKSKIKLVVNRYARDLGLSKEVIGTALNIDVHATLPSDYDAIQRSLLEGKQIAPNSNFAKGVAELADSLGAREATETKKPAKAGGGLLSFFKR